ncbi:MAG: Swt1 family HEPN domain-containing protein [Candidatus Binatus sp.]|uniref:Swt1 family HEPN domain-containing protein n=1 Tax=Candidatus Binatus sp. TaxID=2811406 RepID=UPI0027179286|nr:Swt1 family HEPN domain-containing protein [Candidatus Binatus sp.]MDO8432078.1 Swt1 family HEPN domain-containing protein [Candidatus Binatus sp.]
MAITNYERVGKALDLMREGLKPYVERELRTVFGDKWIEEAARDERRLKRESKGQINWDSQALLGAMWDNWTLVFGKKLGNSERNLIAELRTTRNQWAHSEPFTSDDAYRALDSINRLLTAITAEQAVEVQRAKQELQRLNYAEQTRSETRKLATSPTEGQPSAGLKPWREVITPHPDVASGRFQQAEFAADLAQVYRGEAADEYGKPRDFFQRTFMTHGLEQLLVGAVRRLSAGDNSGDPVVELQTNFGGGKTHSMLALYHLFSGVPPSDLAGVETVLKQAGVSAIPRAKRAVLVGTDIGPAESHRKADGTVVKTLWGELAWQLLGKDGYKLVAESDRKGISPGGELRELFKRAAPCLILIDEWLAHARMLYGVSDLPAGSFDANMTFAQTLTEAAKAVPKTLVVASIPASDTEIGGEGGRAALERIKNVFARIQTPWTPATTEEGFEIVRRRLFQPITDPELFRARDTVAKKFREMYRESAKEFPAQCKEGAYEQRIQKAYPIHPELFDRLFGDWSSLDKFQMTRGVLRLMAAVIHTLWERGDASLLILPGTVPIDAPAVLDEVLKYLESSWRPVVGTDVDGPESVPLRMDQENPALARYSASRRVARTVFIGSAPTLNAAGRGLEDIQIKLGCAQPGETVATFGDALRKLREQTTYLYSTDRRYWYDTQQNVTKLARDRAAQENDEAVCEEIRRRLRLQEKERGEFAKVQACVDAAAVAEDRETRLVILDPAHPHSSKTAGSPARVEAQRILESKGTGPRIFKNTVVFLAADRIRMDDLNRAVRDFMAWKSIDDEKTTLNLDANQSAHAEKTRKESDGVVNQRIPEAYQWLIVPGQEKPKDGPLKDIDWSETKVSGQDALAPRAAKKLKGEESLVLDLAGTRLRMELDRIPLWRGNHVPVTQLADDFAQYLYLPRLRGSEVLAEAIRDGLRLMTWAQDSFAYADSFDEAKGRYVGLRAGQLVTVSIVGGGGMLVKSEIAKAQLEAEAQREDQKTEKRKDDEIKRDQDDKKTGGSAEPKLSRRFHGSAQLNAIRISRDAGQIADEVIQHLTKLPGANVEVTIEIHAEIPEGAPESVVRTVSENCRTLKFRSFDFEDS